MANVIRKSDLEYLTSVHTPDFSATEFIINPVLPASDKKYWKIVGEEVKEMTATEKKAVDDKIAADNQTAQLKTEQEEKINVRMRKLAVDELKTEGELPANFEVREVIGIEK